MPDSEAVNPNPLRSRIGGLSRWHMAAALFLLALSLFLAVRASDEYRWSDWGFGDAQTMLSLRQWKEGGWYSNYFLFIPQGYAKVVRQFDDPNLRQHAHGTCPGSSPRVGPRLWYTHYPAGYLVPYAALFSAGAESLQAMRMLSIALSIAALALMYLLFARLTSPVVSFAAVLFYGLSPAFLGYADTLANQPVDDLLRFGFMLAIVLSTRSGSPVLRRRWLISAWLMEFALSLSSFDSVFFVYLWIIGWDFLEQKGFRWKRYLLFALAPVTAHGLQFLQNVWYLGFSNALIDIKDAFLLKNAANAGYNQGESRFRVILGTISILFNNLLSPAAIMSSIAGVYVGYRILFRRTVEASLPSLRLLAVLFACGLAFVLVLPHAARMPYEARQMMPFAALLVSGMLGAGVSLLREGLASTDEGKDIPGIVLRSGALLLVSVVALVTLFRYVGHTRSPVYFIPDAAEDERIAREIQENRRVDLIRFRQLREDVRFAEMLRQIETPFEPVYFSLNGFIVSWDPAYVPGYPQIMPITEFYSGSRPILCFDAPELLARDIAYMVRTSPVRFSPVLVASDRGEAEAVRVALVGQGVLTETVPRLYDVIGRPVIDLTDSLRWPQ